MLLLVMAGALILIVIGFISTESLFVNQHTFEDTNALNCTKCHNDIYLELTSDLNMPHYNKNCTDCHQHSSVYQDGVEHLAGVKVECQACHPNSTLETANPGGTQGFNYSSNEAHWAFFDAAKTDPLMGGANEACVSCHTRYDIKVTFTRPDYYEFHIDYGTNTFDGGLLNGTPDRLVIEGSANVTNFVNADDVFWRDVNSDNDWDPGEDIFRDDGNSAYNSGDTVLYVGSDGQDAFGGAVEFGTEQEIFYLDSDHDDAYDFSAGTEEPLVYVGTDGGSVSNYVDLKTTHEILQPYTGITWITDAIPLVNTNYYFFDNGFGIPGTLDTNESIILDDGDGIVEEGVLSGGGSPDEIITSGDADLRSFVSADRVKIYDSIVGNNQWDTNEDIVYDSDNDNSFDYFGTPADVNLYIGSGREVAHGNGLVVIAGNLRYLDTDHSGNYTLGEPIVVSSDNTLQSTDELLEREDDIYDAGAVVYKLWDFDINPFTSEFFIDDNNNGVYDDGEAIIRETYRIYNISSSNQEETIITMIYSTDSTGLHTYRNGSRVWDIGTGESLCGDASVGCHQDVYNAINDGYGGGHYTNSTLGGHTEASSDCSYCHRDSDEIDPDNDHDDSTTGSWHSAKRVTCAYEGSCHSTLFTDGLMVEVVDQIKLHNLSYQGDICWSCHRGDFDWSDPTGETIRVYVEDEAADQQVIYNGTTVYSPTNYAGCSCHNDTITNVPTIPQNSGKYVDHQTGNLYDECTKCHKEWYDPHNDTHAIDLNWGQWVSDNSDIPSGFCNSSCHYSINEARPIYIDTTTNWMKTEATNWENNGGRHAYSSILGGDGSNAGSVSCTQYCHTTHDLIPSCAGSSCHLDNDGLTDKRDVPNSHDIVSPGTIDTDRYPCARSDCHFGGAHNPQVPGCHGTGGDGGCEPNTNAHPKHIDSVYAYDFDCTECHYNGTGYNGGQGTFGGSLHNNGAVNVAFDPGSTGTSTYQNVLSPSYAGSGGTCTTTYCHSNGNDITVSGAGSDFKTYETPGWNSSTAVKCGDCHGIPNYYNGTAWRELGTPTTSNSPVHKKHTNNSAVQYTSRYLFWVDATPSGAQSPAFGWMDSTHDPGEAIIQDLNGNRMLDYGVLNGGNNQGATPPQSPDKVYENGTADLTDLIVADNVWYYDADADGTWDAGEDIYYETGGGGNAGDEYNPSKDDTLLYIGTTQDIAADDNTNTADLSTATGDPIMYLDSDHDNVYDIWWGGISEYSGVEEPLINVSSNKATGGNLDSADEVLQGLSSNLKWWYVDFNRFYDFDCSECHYDSSTNTGGVSDGNGTYGSLAHINMSVEVKFDLTTNGIASNLSTYAANASAVDSWDANAKTCYGIWCHSDGYDRDDTDGAVNGNGYPDWSGNGSMDDQFNYHWIKPNWTDTQRSTVFCGSCHFGWDKPMDTSSSDDRPNTGGHRQNQHEGASQFGWHGDADATVCLECHWRYDTYGTADENQWWRAYGSYQHVDASVWAYQGAEVLGQFGPLAESQGYSSTCHNTWPGNWRSGYGNSC
jgi:predicted CxxxxCH...CXXCH cytochrome family protein